MQNRQLRHNFNRKFLMSALDPFIGCMYVTESLLARQWDYRNKATDQKPDGTERDGAPLHTIYFKSVSSTSVNLIEKILYLRKLSAFFLKNN